MALTKISTAGVKDDIVTTAKIADDAVTSALIADDAVVQAAIADDAVNEARLQISNSGSNGEFLSKQSGNTGGLTWAAVTSADTTYAISCVDGDNSDEEKIRLTAGGSGSGTDDVVLEAGTGLSVARSGDKITFTNTVADTTVGGSTGVDFNDNVKVRWGTGNDLEIYHNSPHSIIKNTNTSGYLELATDNFRLLDDNGSEWMIKAVKDGAVELYHNNVKKFETMNAGVTVAGYVAATGDNGYAYVCNDNLKSHWGTAQDLEIYHDSNHSYIDNHTGSLKIRNAAAGNILIEPRDAESSIIAKPDGAVELYYDNAKKFETDSLGTIVTGRMLFGDSSGVNVGRAKFGDSGDLQLYHSSNNNYIVANTTGQDIFFKTSVSSAGDTSSMTVRSDGSITHPDNIKTKWGAGDDLQIYHSGSHSHILNSGSGNLYLQDNSYVEIGRTDEVMIGCVGNGAVNLRYDGTKKLETASNGIQLLDELGLNDAKAAMFGDSDDLKIYHDGTHNQIMATNGYIKVQATNESLYLRGNTVWIQDGSGDENYIKCIDNGAAELYYDNSKKFETTSAGVSVTGNIYQPDDGVHYFGAGNDLYIFHDGTNSYINNLTGNLEIRVKSGEAAIHMVPNGTTKLYYDGAKKLETTSAGGTLTGTWNVGKILQVVHATSTTQSSVSQNVWHEAVEASITPSSTSSKILIQGMITFSESAGDVHVRIYLDNDGSHIGSGSASGSGTSSHSSGSSGRQGWDCTTNPVAYLHSPSSTSSRTYSIRALCSNGAFKINRQINGNQNQANDNAHSTNIVLMEVAG